MVHLGGRLDRDAAGVKGHTLADDRKGGLSGGSAVPAHDHDLRAIDRPLPHAQKRVHAKRLHRGFFKDLDVKAKILHRARGIPAWRVPLMPWMIVATGVLEGLGAVMLMLVWFRGLGAGLVHVAKNVVRTARCGAEGAGAVAPLVLCSLSSSKCVLC
jgi:hypothetical protein